MIHYLLQVVFVQLLCMAVYDLFLKKETFFNWNRAYLLICSFLALILPLFKLKTLSSVIPNEYMVQLPEVIVGSGANSNVPVELLGTGLIANGSSFLWIWLLLIIGMMISFLSFLYKLFVVYSLKKNNNNQEKDVRITKIVVRDSETAFSFFNYVFIGDKIAVEDEKQIIKHEMAHVTGGHSYDLLYFELLRIVFWFNPLVYLYQKRTAELHEFIADAVVAKTSRKAQYQLLLSEVFKTKEISFINTFYKESLLKKRIVMLQKTKSKQFFRLKYLLLTPIVLLSLIYSSCERENIEDKENIESVTLKSDSTVQAIPFMVIDEVPVFPSCENVIDSRTCFQEQVVKHIRKHFRYPSEAQEKGIQGRVSIMFTIATDGTIVNIRKRGPHKLLEAEAVRIIKKLPIMIPGKHKGKVVPVPFSIPITFKLGGQKTSSVLSSSKTNKPFFVVARNVPIFPGCENVTDKSACFVEKVKTHIRKHFYYPKDVQEEGVQGKVMVMMSFDEQGNVGMIKTIGPDKRLEAVCVAIISKLPKMKVPIVDNKPKKTMFSIPITFKLQ